MQLPTEQQKILADLIRFRNIENRRSEIARDSLTAFRKGELKPQTVQAIISELRQSLKED